MLCGWRLQMMVFLSPLNDHSEGKNNEREKSAEDFESRIIRQGKNHTYRRVNSRNKQRAHQAARANQLWYQDADQLEIWMTDLQAEIPGASWTRARVRAGGTLDKKSDKRKLSASATMTLRMKERSKQSHVQMRSHRRLILRYALLSRLVFFILLQLAAQLPLFDTSPLLVPLPRPLHPLLRWDSFHFLHIAKYGYVYEHEWAFLPGAIYLTRYLGSTLDGLIDSDSFSNILSAGLLAVLACDTSQTLYSLSLYHLQSPALALSASLLSLLPTSPATLYFVPCTEPFFTYFSYRGMLLLTRYSVLR
jgi:hypothetical protein